MVVLDTLAPAERLAFVLHDIFAVPFDDIAPSWSVTEIDMISDPGRLQHVDLAALGE